MYSFHTVFRVYTIYNFVQTYNTENKINIRITLKKSALCFYNDSAFDALESLQQKLFSTYHVNHHISINYTELWELQ